MDALGDVLASLRLSGGVVVEGEAKGDWCVLSQLQPEDWADYFPPSAQVVAYHYVTSGEVFAQVDGHEPITAGAGSILLFPRNDRHMLFTAKTESPVDSHELMAPDPTGRLAKFAIGDEGQKVQFYCGFLGVATSKHPLLDCLPPLLVIDAADAATAQWLQGNLHFLTSEDHAPETIARIAELLFAEAVRQYVDRLPQGEGGWLAGLRDPAVARALSIIHQRYAEDLNVEGLAREAGVSRSVLGERFVALLGEPPMRYCARWRMRMAANMLRDGLHTAANVAYAVGFNAEAAFNRAFKREYGVPPATWRKQRGAAEPPTGDAGPIAAAKQDERIERCVSSDGSTIAYSDMGSGFPLVQPAIWFHDMIADWHTPAWRHWLGEIVPGRRLIRIDMRGSGLSEPDPPGWSFDAQFDDFRAVIDHSGVERFDILGISHGVLVALAYAARFPERVRKLALVSGYAAGFGVRGDEAEIKRRESLLGLARNFSNSADPSVFGHMLGALYWPGGRGDVIDWFSERLVVITKMSEALQLVFREIDLRDQLPKIEAETLVAHSRGDRIIPFACAEQIASGIKGATLLPLDSENHVLLGDEPAWGEFAPRLRKFLAA